MKNRAHLVFLLLIISFSGCNRNNDTEKYQTKRNNVINVKDDIVEIVKDDVLIGSISRLYLFDNYLIIKDVNSFDMSIHLFNRKNYQYLTSSIPKGQGPGEITVMGHIAGNPNKKEFYVSDHGKLKIFTYPIDSILRNPYYVPEVKKEMNNTQFPSEYIFINDTLCFARIIKPTGDVGHNEFSAKWNMLTDEIHEMKYSHPKVEKKRISIAVSMEHKIFVECYHNHDLITIMDLDGNLKYNLYGSNWHDGDIVKIYHFGNIVIIGNKIIASYSGGDKDGDYLPNKILVFNLSGDYIKTLDVGYRISDFCYDEQSDRLLFTFDDMIQFGYLQLTDELLN